MDVSQANKAALVGTGIKVGGTALLVGLAYVFVRKLLKGRTNADGTSVRIAPTLKNTKIETSKLTITTSDAALFANTLYTAMLNFGTDEASIYSVINKINTKDDMLLVIKTFGMKMYLMGGRAAFLGQNINLIGWLRAELDSKEIAKMKPKFNSWGIPL